MDAKSTITAVVAMCLVALLILAPVACSVNRQSIIAEAIKNGGDPIAIKCALDIDTSSICLVKAMSLTMSLNK